MTSTSFSSMSRYWQREGITSFCQTLLLVIRPYTLVIGLHDWMIRVAFIAAIFWCDALFAPNFWLINCVPLVSMMPCMSLNVLFSYRWIWLTGIDMERILKCMVISINFCAPCHVHEGLWILLWIIWVHLHTGFLFARIVKVRGVRNIIVVPATKFWDMGVFLQPRHCMRIVFNKNS